MLVGRVELDHDGVGELANSAEIRMAVDKVARRIAAAARAQLPGVKVEVTSYTTDRAAAAVDVLGGDSLQATQGILTRAVGAVGLTITARGR